MTTEGELVLTSEQEELLLIVAAEAARSVPVGFVRVETLPALVDRTDKDCRKLLGDLGTKNLIALHAARPGARVLYAVSLTDRGQDVSFGLALVEPKGRVPEFAADLTPLQLSVLDAAAEREVRASGSGFTRAQLRTAVRNAFEAGATLEEADDAVSSVASRFLEVGPGAGTFVKLTARGLLASKWGMNSVEIIDGLFGLLRALQRRDAALRQFSWSQARTGLLLPRKAHDLFYVTVTGCGLGSGIFQHSGDDWWSVPDNLDEILEETSATSFLRKTIQRARQSQAVSGVKPAPEHHDATEGNEMARQQPTADPKKVFIIHGRNVDARNSVEQFVRSVGLEPLDFDQVSADLGGSPFVGEVVRRGMDLAQGIIALFTADEFSALRPSFQGVAEKAEDIQRWQSRPNVIFEAGMAYGMAPKRTVLVTLGSEVSLFSDVAGIHLVRLDNHVESRKKLRQKLIGMKCSVNERGDAWTDPARSGDFETCINGLPGVSTRSPFAEARTVQADATLATAVPASGSGAIGVTVATTSTFPQKELLLAAQSVKNMLGARAVGKGGDDREYQALRQRLLDYPDVQGRLPECLLTCRSLDEFWGFIQPKLKSYAERREYLRVEFEPVLSMLETKRSAAT